MIHAIREIDRIFSVHDAHSPLSQFNSRMELSVAVDDPFLFTSVAQSLQCARDFGGVFDPTVESLMRCHGFRYEQTHFGLVPTHGRDWDYRMIECDTCNGRITRESATIQLDSGGWAKGLAAQHAIGAAVKVGASHAQVSCGGDIFRYDAAGLSAWECAIRDPLKGRSESAVRVRHRYPTVATSGNYETVRISVGGEQIGHLMDPRTGAPAESDLISVSVFGHDGLFVDAASSALFVMGKTEAHRWLATNPEYGAILIDRTWPDSADGITAVGALEMI
jgi:thiamine biosynthesis lipoprotein